MTALRPSTLHFWFSVAAIFCDVVGRCYSTGSTISDASSSNQANAEMSGVAAHSTTCVADEWCQQRSASLVQRRAVTTRVEPQVAPLQVPAAAVASAPVSSSSTSKEEHSVALAVAGGDTPKQTQVSSEQQMNPVMAMPADASGDSLVKESMPVIQDTTRVDTRASPSEAIEDAGARGSSHSFFKGLKDLDGYLRGKPQVLNIFVMMLLPAGMCAVMCCICNIINVMEDGQGSRDDKADEGAGLPESRQTLGEAMHSSDAPKRSQEPLCAELLAPPGSTTECVIALPSISNAGQDGGSTFERTIVSKTGQPIVTVRVAITRAADGMPDVAGGGSYGVPGQMLERISLIAFKKQNALGFCELRVPNGGVSAARPLKCCIYRPTGDLFATLEEEKTGVVSSLLAASGSSSNAPRGSSHDSRCYMLTTVATGTRFWIQGDIKERILVVVSESNEQKPIITVNTGEELQFQREGSSYYGLRVQPKADAGVVIMALFAMDRLRAAQS